MKRAKRTGRNGMLSEPVERQGGTEGDVQKWPRGTLLLEKEVVGVAIPLELWGPPQRTLDARPSTVRLGTAEFSDWGSRMKTTSAERVGT